MTIDLMSVCGRKVDQLMKKSLILVLVILFMISSHHPSLASSYALTLPDSSPDNPFAAADRSRQERLVRSAQSRPLPFLAMTAAYRQAAGSPQVSAIQETIKQYRNKSGDKFIVRFSDDVSLQKLHDLLLDEEYQLLGYSSKRQIVLLSEDIEAFLNKADGMIDYLEPDQKIKVQTVNDPLYSDQWALQAVAAPAAWAYTTGNPGVGGEVTVAVIDSGITREHPDLIYADIRDGYDYFTGGASRSDYIGHGTKVSGIITAETNNMIGIAGVCWNVALVPLAVVSETGTASYTDLIRAIMDAADAEIDIINISLGGSAYLQALADALEYAYDRGCIIVASAGNEGTSSYMYPAANKHVIAVGSIDSSLNWSAFSTFHDRLDVCAPGQAVLTTSGSTGYAYVSGTSFAAPHIAGAAALATALAPELTHDSFMDLLIRTSRDLGPDGYDYKYGYGLVDAGEITARLSVSFDVSVSGTAVFGSVLSAQTSGASHDANTVAFQWLRTGSPVSQAVSSEYLIGAEDIGQEITVQASVMTDAGLMTTVSKPVIPVKADRAAPAAPVLLSKTDHSLTLVSQPGYEYLLDRGSWQTRSDFNDLNPDTVYLLYTRTAETDTHFASAASKALSVTTDKSRLSGAVKITGTAEFARTLTADISEVNPIGAGLAFTWKRGSTVVGSKNQYTIVGDDIGKTITVLVSGTGSYTGSVGSGPVVPRKAPQAAPAAPVVVEKTSRAITLAIRPGYEYSVNNNQAWQTAGLFNNLAPDTEYEFRARIASTATHLASPASQVLTVITNQETLSSTVLMINPLLSLISGIKLGTPVQTFISAFSEPDRIKVIRDNAPVSQSDFVGTGMTVRLIDGTETIQELTAVVTGDITGNGQSSLTDFVQVRSHLLAKSILKGVHASAADINGDGQITLTDFIRMKAHLLGHESIKPQ